MMAEVRMVVIAEGLPDDNSTRTDHQEVAGRDRQAHQLDQGIVASHAGNPDQGGK